MIRLLWKLSLKTSLSTFLQPDYSPRLIYLGISEASKVVISAWNSWMYLAS